MHYWSPYHPYAQFLGFNGLPYDYYSVPFNYNWQFPPIAPLTALDSSINCFDYPESKPESKYDITVMKTEDTERDEQRTNGIIKKCQAKESKSTNSTRNIKANILKDFVRSIKRDATPVLLAIKALNSEYSVKKFIQQLTNNLPSEGKYIRTKTVVQLCKRHPDQEFSVILRIVLRNFLKGEYRNFVVLKRKNCFQHLRISREIQEKLCNQKNTPHRTN